jgi:hypothetical protein
MMLLLLVLLTISHCVGSVDQRTINKWVEEAVANETALIRTKAELLFEMGMRDLKLHTIKANALERESKFACEINEKEAKLERLRVHYARLKEAKLRALKEKLEELMVW